MVKCPHKAICLSYGFPCGSCKNNKEKKDYYEPSDKKHIWPIPYYKPTWFPRQKGIDYTCIKI